MSKKKKHPHRQSAIGPCSTVIQIVGRRGTGSLPRTIAPPDHPTDSIKSQISSMTSRGKKDST